MIEASIDHARRRSAGRAGRAGARGCGCAFCSRSKRPDATTRGTNLTDERAQTNRRRDPRSCRPFITATIITLIREKIDVLNEVTHHLAENMMNTAVRSALKGTKV